ncbi:hypothetical protein F5B17DRAFT_430306 [Nemania serpens]|nr:hypothetical protein F5B17DRAFT_430306 [Nemania serpens]
MCVGIMVYYVGCGHSAMQWRRCARAGTPQCRRVHNGGEEEFREEKCRHAWCPCDYLLWACCRCHSANLWADCVDCRHLRCRDGCEAGGGSGTRFPGFQDPRYLRWHERFVEQERERGRVRVLREWAARQGA